MPLIWLLNPFCDTFAQSIITSPFRHVTVRGTFVLHLTKDSRYTYRVVAPASRANQYIARQQAGQLLLEEQAPGGRTGLAPVEVFITYPAVDKITVSGQVRVADITGFADDTLAIQVLESSQASLTGNLGRLDITTEESATATVTGTISRLDIQATYSGRVTLRGQGNQLCATLSEGAQLNAYGFRVRQANVSATATAKAMLTVTDSVWAVADPRSTVMVKGNFDVLKRFYTNEKRALQYGRDLLREKDLAEAKYFFQLTAALFPSSWRAFEGLNEVYRAQNQPDSARQMGARAQTLSPTAVATAADYLGQGYQRATVRNARNANDAKITTCQEFTLNVEIIRLPVCVGNNLPETYRHDGQEVWVKYNETKAGKLYDRGYPVEMNDCCGLIVRLVDVKPRSEH